MAHPENVDILDENGNPTGRVMAHTGTNLVGEWHAGIHVALYTSDRRVLLQQRSRAIMFYPGQWELGIGGVVAAGEQAHEAALREATEEIGTSLRNLQPVTRWKYNHHMPRYGMHVRVFLYAYIAEIDPAHLQLQESEVQDVRLLSMGDVHGALFSHKGLPHIQMLPYEGYYRQMLHAIETRFKPHQAMQVIQ